ncbi:hypothetical protein [Gluconobacter thailandicus]|uniref:hypothetical protein n=2 Tax=Gluconobacter thailandicus TaxID=257438 RepID=UPI00037DCCB3|nr:hypothetical protein [Gluconobacter thailandicus]
MSDAKRSQQPLKAVRSRRVMRNVGVLLGGRAINAPHSRIHIWPTTHLLGSHGCELIAMMYPFARTMSDLWILNSGRPVLKYGLHLLTSLNSALALTFNHIGTPGVGTYVGSARSPLASPSQHPLSKQTFIRKWVTSGVSSP